MEEDEHQARPLATGLLERNGQERATVCRRGRDSEPVAETIVLAEPAGRETLPPRAQRDSADALTLR